MIGEKIAFIWMFYFSIFNFITCSNSIITIIKINIKNRTTLNYKNFWVNIFYSIITIIGWVLLSFFFGLSIYLILLVLFIIIGSLILIPNDKKLLEIKIRNNELIPIVIIYKNKWKTRILTFIISPLFNIFSLLMIFSGFIFIILRK